VQVLRDYSDWWDSQGCPIRLSELCPVSGRRGLFMICFFVVIIHGIVSTLEMWLFVGTFKSEASWSQEMLKMEISLILGNRRVYAPGH